MTTNTSISCLIVDDESIAREVIETHLSKMNNIIIVDSCSNAVDAFNVISNTTIDLVFLDINMPQISGIAFAKSINSDIKVIFTTAYRDYAVEGFELKSFERLQKSVNTYFDVYSKLNDNLSITADISDFIFVRSNRKMIKIDFESIIYIESYSDYLKIHTSDKTIITRETITAIEVKLPKSQFLRIHRSYIIALKYINSYTNEQITINRKSLPISRSYKNDVLQFLQKF
jgi:DNA-binding LytR/AlgR family response regulator